MTYSPQGQSTKLYLLSNLRGGVGRNLTAQLFSQIVTLAIQILSIPILLASWGVEVFGVWLILTALPAYLTLSDFGFTFVAKNTMTMEMARGETQSAVKTFQSIFVLLLTILSVLMAATSLVVFAVPFDFIFNTANTPIDVVRTTILAQVASALLYQLFLLFCAGVRADGRPATETMFAAIARLIESIGICLTAALGGDIALAAIVGLATRIASFVAIIGYTKIRIRWLAIGFARADFARLRELVAPSLTYMLVPIANAALIQGPIVILGAVTGPSTVALYSVTRTVARLGMAGANMVNFGLSPEYSRLFGKNDQSALNSLLKVHISVIGVGILLYAVLTAVLSSPAVSLLSHAQIVAVPWLTVLVATSVCFEMAWSGLFTPLAARNTHKAAAVLFAIIAVVCIGSASLFPSLGNLALSLLVAHGAMLTVTTLIFRKSIFPLMQTGGVHNA